MKYFPVTEMAEVQNCLNGLFNFYYRLIGAIFIVLGLYLVLWGKNNEKKVTKSSSLTNPLLKAEEENKEIDAAPKDIP